MTETTRTTIDKHDRIILRQLASVVAELAARPIEDEKRDLWYQHNALEPTRPVIFCDPENGWNEIINQSDLKCRIIQARVWEMSLRREIFWGQQLCDDRVIQPFFDVAHVFTESDWGVQASVTGGEDGGSYIWDAPIKSYDDINKLHFPNIQLDKTATQDRFEQAQEIFDGIMNVRLRTVSGLPTSIFWSATKIPVDIWWWSTGITDTLTRLRGLQQVMYDFIDYPEELHSLMAFLRDGYLAKLGYLQNNGLLSLNNDGTYVGSGGFGWTKELPQADYQGEVRLCDLWGFADNQEMVGISPSTFAEFVLPYQLPILELFGLNCYGCCEPLDRIWEHVRKVPRLRRVSVSPWANISGMAEKLENRFILSMKVHPGAAATSLFDEGEIRRGLRQAFHITRDCRVEAILKDTHTICKDPNRVVRWVRIAQEEALNL